MVLYEYIAQFGYVQYTTMDELEIVSFGRSKNKILKSLGFTKIKLATNMYFAEY